MDRRVGVQKKLRCRAMDAMSNILNKSWSPWHKSIARPPPKGQVAGSTPAGDTIIALIFNNLI